VETGEVGKKQSVPLEPYLLCWFLSVP